MAGAASGFSVDGAAGSDDARSDGAPAAGVALAAARVGLASGAATLPSSPGHIRPTPTTAAATVAPTINGARRGMPSRRRARLRTAVVERDTRSARSASTCRASDSHSRRGCSRSAISGASVRPVGSTPKAGDGLRSSMTGSASEKRPTSARSSSAADTRGIESADAASAHAVGCGTARERASSRPRVPSSRGRGAASVANTGRPASVSHHAPTRWSWASASAQPRMRLTPIVTASPRVR